MPPSAAAMTSSRVSPARLASSTPLRLDHSGSTTSQDRWQVGMSTRAVAPPCSPEVAPPLGRVGTLELGSGVPVLEYVRTAYTKERPVRLTKTVFAGDRNRLVYELGQLEALYEQDVP
jgi:hypothetical protein